MTITQPYYKGARLVLWLFVLCTIISYLYVLITGTYNGDFLGVKPRLLQMELFLVFVYTILPFFVLWGIYKLFKSYHNVYSITIPIKAFGQFLLFNLIFQIVVTIVFGVGLMGQSIYTAPMWLKPIIQISLRFDCLWGVCLYIIVAKKGNKFQYLLLLLCLILSSIRSSLGILAWLVVLLCIKNYAAIIRFVRKRFIWCIVMAIFLPTAVGILYDYRDSKRHKTKIELAQTLSKTELIFGKLVGRMSSFSNVGIVKERENIITKLSANWTPFQYPKETLTAIDGKLTDDQDVSYEEIMQESFGNKTRKTHTMCGTAGILFISLHSSIIAFILTLLTMFGLVYAMFFFASMFHYEGMVEFAFVTLCFMMIGGNAKMLMLFLLYFILFTCFFLIVNFLARVK